MVVEDFVFGEHSGRARDGGRSTEAFEEFEVDGEQKSSR